MGSLAFWLEHFPAKACPRLIRDALRFAAEHATTQEIYRASSVATEHALAHLADRHRMVVRQDQCGARPIARVRVSQRRTARLAHRLLTVKARSWRAAVDRLRRRGGRPMSIVLSTTIG